MGVAGGLDNGGGAPRIAEHEFDGVGAELGVEWQWHDAGPHGPEEGLDKFDAVADAEQQPVPGPKPEPAKGACDTFHALVEGAVGDLAWGEARQVDEGGGVGRVLCRVVVEVSEVGAVRFGGIHVAMQGSVMFATRRRHHATCNGDRAIAATPVLRFR